MKKEYDLSSLYQAIEDFNKWTKGAALYFRTDARNFDVEVFHNDVSAAETIFANHCVVVYSKGEQEGDKKIGKRRSEYIQKFIEMLDDGWKPEQIEYQLAEPGIF